MSNKLHTISAYVLLLLSAYFIGNAMLSPFSSQLASLKKETFVANSELDALRNKLTTNLQLSSGLERQLSELSKAGELGAFENQDDASLKLRAVAKSALDAQSAAVQQMRPSNQYLADGVSWSRLELSFGIAESKLGALLIDLSKESSLHIELLSLRKQRYVASASATNMLDANMVLQLNYLGQEVLPDYLSTVKDGSLNVSAAPLAQNVAGLFDSSVRRRLQSPSIDHYQLSAITVSDNARVAVIADVGSANTRRLKVGDMLDAWKIESIDVDGVRLSHNGVIEVLAR